jgi:hypothetical protein
MAKQFLTTVNAQQGLDLWYDNQSLGCSFAIHWHVGKSDMCACVRGAGREGRHLYFPPWSYNNYLCFRTALLEISIVCKRAASSGTRCKQSSERSGVLSVVLAAPLPTTTLCWIDLIGTRNGIQQYSRSRNYQTSNSYIDPNKYIKVNGPTWHLGSKFWKNSGRNSGSGPSSGIFGPGVAGIIFLDIAFFRTHLSG